MISLSTLCLSLPVPSRLANSAIHFLGAFPETFVQMQEVTSMTHKYVCTCRQTVQIHRYTICTYRYCIYTYINSLLMQIVESYALLFFHLIYLRTYSKSVPKQLSHSSTLLYIIPGCRHYLCNWVPNKRHVYYSHYFFVTDSTHKSPNGYYL